MAIGLKIGRRSFIKSFKKVSRKEKIFILKVLESDLLSDWDEYEKRPNVKEKIDLALQNYKSGNVVNLDNINI